MTNLLAELRAANTKPGPVCSLCTWLRSRPDRDEWIEALADLTIPASVIWEAARKRGYSRGQQPIGDHRRGKHDEAPG